MGSMYFKKLILETFEENFYQTLMKTRNNPVYGLLKTSFNIYKKSIDHDVGYSFPLFIFS